MPVDSHPRRLVPGISVPRSSSGPFIRRTFFALLLSCTPSTPRRQLNKDPGLALRLRLIFDGTFARISPIPLLFVPPTFNSLPRARFSKEMSRLFLVADIPPPPSRIYAFFLFACLDRCIFMHPEALG
jgi:hypothetical protein